VAGAIQGSRIRKSALALDIAGDSPINEGRGVDGHAPDELTDVFKTPIVVSRLRPAYRWLKADAPCFHQPGLAAVSSRHQTLPPLTP